MRIRRRPPFSSFPSFASPTAASPHSLQDPSLYLPHHAPNGRDAIANNGGGGEREGKGAPELHSDEHPPKDPLDQDPFYRRSPLRPPPLPRPTPPRPPPPCLDPYDETKGCSSIHSSSTHLTDVGLLKVQDFGKEEEVVAATAAAAAAAKSEEERGTLLNAKMGWDDNAQLVNSNMRIDGISGASILLEAARQLEAATERRKKGRGGCSAEADNDDCKSDEKLKEKKNMAKESGCRSVDASSLRNNCTGIVGKDNDGYHNEDGPTAVREKDEKGGAAVNGSGRPNGKKRRSPAVLMEGSRCSRVNGRGWRCCQQTLVGYSLCEHHLGKGRLRSVSSVRGQIGATTRPKKKKNSKTPPDQGEEDKEKRAIQLQQQKKNEPWAVDGATTVMDNGIEEEGETSEDKSTKKKKTTKMGTVKARSISSLLDEAELSAPPLSQQQAQYPITVDSKQWCDL